MRAAISRSSRAYLNTVVVVFLFLFIVVVVLAGVVNDFDTLVV